MTTLARGDAALTSELPLPWTSSPGRRPPILRSFRGSCPAILRRQAARLTDKVTTVADAVTPLVHDGDYLAIGGFGCDRIPTAVVHEILRQGKQHLRFAGHTATHDFQILCAGNLTGRGQTLAAWTSPTSSVWKRGACRRTPAASWNPARSSHRMDAITPWPCASRRPPWACRSCRCARCSAPTRFATAPPRQSPARSPARSWPLLPALYPDVAVIHVHEADRFGNCRIRGTTVADLDLARAPES